MVKISLIFLSSIFVLYSFVTKANEINLIEETYDLIFDYYEDNVNTISKKNSNYNLMKVTDNKAFAFCFDWDLIDKKISNNQKFTKKDDFLFGWFSADTTRNWVNTILLPEVKNRALSSCNANKEEYKANCNCSLLDVNGVNHVEIPKYISAKYKKTQEEKDEEKRKAKKAEERRIAEEKRKAKEEEEKRIAEAKKKEEEAKQAQQEELYVIGSGTGFFVNKEGYIVTNEHVAGICQSLASYINGETHLFRIISLDKRNDLALLRGEYRNKTYLNINILGAEFGEDIMAFGFPLAENLSSSVKLTRGIVSSLSGPENDISLIQIDAAIQPGNSGGPVLNYNGQVVGVASSGLNKIQMLLDEESPYIPENVNFAVSANTLTGFLRSNSITIFNETYEKQSSQDLAKIGMPPTIQLHCLNTMAAHKQLRESEKYNDVLLKKVVNLK